MGLGHLKTLWYDIVEKCPRVHPITAHFSPFDWPRLETLHFQAPLSGILSSLNFASLKHLHLINTRDDLLAPEGSFTNAPFFDGLETLIFVRTAFIGFADLNRLSMPLLKTLDIQNSADFHFNLTWLAHAAPQLEKVNLQNSAVVGSVEALLPLTRLKELRLGSSDVSGWFDDRFAALTQLEVIVFEVGPAALSVDHYLGFFTQLKELTVLSRAQGTLYHSIGQCKALEVLQLQNFATGSSLPSEITSLVNLRILSISSKGGPIQDIWPSIGDLKNLEYLNLAGNQFGGTIPIGLTRLANLAYIDLSQNYLTGNIPDFDVPGLILDLGWNRLFGPIPDSVAKQALELKLNNNALGPLVPDVLATNSHLLYLDLSYNKFSKLITKLPSSLQHALLSYNDFHGELTDIYCGIEEVALDNNQFYGSIDVLFDRACNISLLKLHDNKLNGTISSNFAHNQFLKSVDISNNFLTGSLSAFPGSIRKFYAAGNNFTGELSADVLNSIQFAQRFSELDLSRNQLECPTPSAELGRLFFSSLHHISLAHNRFKCLLVYSASSLQPSIISPNIRRESLAFPTEFIQSVPTAFTGSLDLSHNQFFGNFFPVIWTQLVNLNLAGNDFSGHFAYSLQDSFPILSSMDLSMNHFAIAASQFAHLPRLFSIKAANNEIYGTLTLNDMNALQTADFSSNQISGIDLTSIGRGFVNQNLQFLSIANQPVLGVIGAAELKRANLVRKSESAPSKNVKGAICFGLHFNQSSSLQTTFNFDESLFTYAQCQCDDGHFGLPLTGCSSCPSEGIDVCSTHLLNVSKNWFTFSRKDSSDSNLMIETESCIYTPAQELTLTTNCNGLWFQQELPQQRPFSSALEAQCREGSEGRLCSKCSCNSDKCYFMSGTVCHSCTYVASNSASIGISIAVIVFLVLFLAGIMLFVLRSKRKPSIARWTELPLWKRFFYRLHHLTSLGHITILITFLQLSSELTHWDTRILKGFLQALNGTGESLGITCLLPFLSHPLANLIATLMLPVLVITIVGISIGLAELISWLLFKQDEETSLDSDDTSDVVLLKRTVTHRSGRYPATALFTSVSISVIRFFYFGTALAAHKYIFSSAQPYTGINYVKNQPWMRYSDAFVLIGVSIPAIVIYDFVLPLLFVLLCWKLRRYLKDERVQRFMGSLFENFSQKCFWWEIVNILRKLWIALILQGFSASNPIQSTLVVSMLAGTVLIQSLLMPWKSKAENIIDSTSTILLLTSLHALSSGALTSSKAMFYIVSIINALFFFGVVSLIVFETIFGKTAYQQRQARDLDSDYESNYVDHGFFSLNTDVDGNTTQGEDFSIMKSGLFSAPPTSSSVANSEDESM